MPHSPHSVFLRRAIELATDNVRNNTGGPFGAVIVKDGVIIGEAGNSVTATNDPTAHAEVNAIRAACRAAGSFLLEGAVIYSSCEPCPMCLAAIYWARLSAVYFGNTQQDAARAGFDDAFLYEEFRKEMPERKIPAIHIAGTEAGNEAWQSFQAWLESTARVEY